LVSYQCFVEWMPSTSHAFKYLSNLSSA
jgi:hypothetical protein